MTPNRREGGDRVAEDDDAPMLPATVVAAHLNACATELAVGRGAPNVSDLADLTSVVHDLVAGQQQIASALARLADQLTASRHDDMSALAEVLTAAATATGHAADALAESRPVLDIVLSSAGPDAKL